MTGNGKSILLGFACAMFALLGSNVSCACYSSHLSSRDFQAFADLFRTFGVEGQIVYSTIDEVAKRFVNSQGSLQDAVVHVLKHGTQPAKLPAAADRRPTVLLCDEVRRCAHLWPVFPLHHSWTA
jgi:hypothetical protein